MTRLEIWRTHVVCSVVDVVVDVVVNVVFIEEVDMTEDERCVKVKMRDREKGGPVYFLKNSVWMTAQDRWCDDAHIPGRAPRVKVDPSPSRGLWLVARAQHTLWLADGRPLLSCVPCQPRKMVTTCGDLSINHMSGFLYINLGYRCLVLDDSCSV